MSNISFGQLDDMPRTITDYTCNGECSRCGGCCTNFLPISKHDKIRISHFIYMNNIKEQKRLFPTAKKSIDLTCPFFSEAEHKCLIYPVRPLICRRFICNQPIDLITEQKNVLLDRFGMTDLRKEFFNT